MESAQVLTVYVAMDSCCKAVDGHPLLHFWLAIRAYC